MSLPVGAPLAAQLIDALRPMMPAEDAAQPMTSRQFRRALRATAATVLPMTLIPTRREISQAARYLSAIDAHAREVN